MPVIDAIRALVLGAALLAAAAMAGDPAAEPPASLAGSLAPVADVGLDDLDAQARDSIRLARTQLNEALRQQPVQAEQLAAAYGELGGLYQVHLVFPAAADCYHNAMQLAPAEFRWAYYAAYLDDHEGRTRQALARYRHAAGLKPGYKALSVRLGNVLLDLNEADAAQAAFEQVVDAAGLEAASLYGLGQVALLKREYGKAVDAFSRALELQPSASAIHYPLAQALRALQRNDEAKAQLALRGTQSPVFRDPQIESLEALKIGSRMHFIRAMKAVRARDYAGAGEAFAQGLASEPENVLARISYARALYLAGDKAAAVQALEAALALAPDNALGLFLRGLLAAEDGDAETAVACYERAIRAAPDHAGAHQYLADHYYRQGNHAAAAGHYAGSLRGEPNNLAAMIPYLGALLQGEAPAATLLAELEAAMQRFPDYPGFRPLQILLKAGSPDAALRDPQAALASARQLDAQQPIPPHRELLALALAANGDFSEALSIEEALYAYARRAMPAETDRIERMLAYYREKTLPPLDELINYAALQPVPFDAGVAFRDYPAARPY